MLLVCGISVTLDELALLVSLLWGETAEDVDGALEDVDGAWGDVDDNWGGVDDLEGVDDGSGGADDDSEDVSDDSAQAMLFEVVAVGVVTIL